MVGEGEPLSLEKLRMLTHIIILVIITFVIHPNKQARNFEQALAGSYASTLNCECAATDPSM